MILDLLFSMQSKKMKQRENSFYKEFTTSFSIIYDYRKKHKFTIHTNNSEISNNIISKIKTNIPSHKKNEKIQFLCCDIAKSLLEKDVCILKYQNNLLHLLNKSNSVHIYGHFYTKESNDKIKTIETNSLYTCLSPTFIKQSTEKLAKASYLTSEIIDSMVSQHIKVPTTFFQRNSIINSGQIYNFSKIILFKSIKDIGWFHSSYLPQDISQELLTYRLLKSTENKLFLRNYILLFISNIIQDIGKKEDANFTFSISINENLALITRLSNLKDLFLLGKITNNEIIRLCYDLI